MAEAHRSSSNGSTDQRGEADRDGQNGHLPREPRDPIPSEAVATIPTSGGCRPTSTERRIALVCNRFGDGVAGGAEVVMHELGRGLRARGWLVDVLASAARDLYTWHNELPEGESWEHDLRVLRFRTEMSCGSDRERIGQRIGFGAAVSLAEQYRWINGSVRVPGMHRYLVDHASDYQAIVFAPYLFWTTFACAEIAPDRTVLFPCLHDEPPAYLEIFKPMFEGSRGILFQTEPEAKLAARIFHLPPRSAVVGSGIRVPASYDPDGFRRKHGLSGDFLFFAGRREWGKGWLELMAHLEFANSVLERPLSLVTCGVGDVGPAPANTRIVDLGYLSDEERSNAMAAATAYVQPSAMESFSRTIMEAWLAETPVIANGASAVVTWHCARSEAGLVYQDRYEFAECLRLLTSEPALVGAMTRRGRAYVLDHYQWPEVLDRVEASLGEWVA
ncbi:MAG: glycosyltransferase family 4 protein [Acidimicrobiaceae bacterium]|nr:glycosyltransferase family 4 protein [Acidimicrobiaceae bacterium]